jgi:hypothetical protein
MNSIRWSVESQRFYTRKRAEGKRHTHAVLALSRRRVNVLWAMLRDQRPYTPTHLSWQLRMDKIIGKPSHVRHGHAPQDHELRLEYQ